jgi:simple sugar transport system ATP-binding protein
VVSVLHRGALIFTRALARTSDADLETQMQEVTAAIMGAGKSRAASVPRPGLTSDEVVLDVRNVTLGRGLTDVSLTLHAGEIVGVAGVEGNGQHELVAVLARDQTPDAGDVVGGTAAVIHADRQVEGLVLEASVRDNLVLGELGGFAGRAGLLDLGKLEAAASARLTRSGAPPDLERPARTLSGGNQQKIVVARAMARLGRDRARVLVAAQPTRGVDLGATEDIHDQLRAAADEGAGVLVLSTNLDELRALCSRILVLSRGRFVADLPPSTSDEELGRRMLGMASS